MQTLNIILRPDVRGSIEAIEKSSKLPTPRGAAQDFPSHGRGVSEADVHLAHASDAIIIGFSVVPDEVARVWPKSSACKSAATTSSIK